MGIVFTEKRRVTCRKIVVVEPVCQAWERSVILGRFNHVSCKHYDRATDHKNVATI